MATTPPPDSPTQTGAAPAPFPEGGYRLMVVDGPDQGRFLQLESGSHTIGKGADCALVLTDAQVSRHHVSVTISPAGIHLRDLGSKNGTFLSEARVGEGLLFPGAVVRIGRSSLRLVSSWAATARPLSSSTSVGRLHGWSDAMRQVFAQIEDAAPTEATVLIEGETGCGKELCAEAIHALSPRAKKPYVVADMSGIAPTLLESELFGHVRGAFTGAHSDRTGAFVESHGGTLFLDEIGELPLDAQPRLLRALEQHRVKPVGGNAYRVVDMRVIAATNRPLEQEVHEGQFRADLFYRLAVVRIRLPPLRERKEDIPQLARLFCAGRDVELAPETAAVLSEYDWPGNVRELRNTMERALSRLPAGQRSIEPGMLGLQAAAASDAIPWPKIGQADFVTSRDRMLAAWEREYLQRLLDRCGGNVSRAAREGGIDRVYLHRLLKRHQLRGGRERTP